jgi:gamma-glutamyltranspeptidase/glutathione hydrolase
LRPCTCRASAYTSTTFLGEDDINPAGFHRLARRNLDEHDDVTDHRRRRESAVLGALGSGGSNRIRSAILQALLNLLLYRRPPDEAVNAARLHVEGQEAVV